ncbi:MAG: DUF3883 domain-containing protein [Methylacidiphilales bacterium]|nr:DUF3883 domain-containing protein [Candidatus Methylacidiphilales bacterium]
MEGFVRVGREAEIRIERLGAQNNDDAINGVRVVWCAQHPRGYGIVIVGWYEDAIVHRKPMDATVRLGFERHAYNFRIEADALNCVLLQPEERDFIVQERGRAEAGAVFGMADLGYVDERAPSLRKRIDRYISNRKLARRTIERIVTPNQEVDPEHNAEVEQAAIAVVRNHFVGWVETNVQKDNKGWDLEFKIGRKDFRRVEVKGRSIGLPAAVRLSPNEACAFDRAIRSESESETYRLAIVTNALSAKPDLLLFQYVADKGGVDLRSDGARINDRVRRLIRHPHRQRLIQTMCQATSLPTAIEN